MSEMTFITHTGCYLDSHRGHYIQRDAIELAIGYGFIVGSFEQFALNSYEEFCGYEGYPHDALTDLCDEAVAWLNSGRVKCADCGGSGLTYVPGISREIPGEDDDERGKRQARERTGAICLSCSGHGRINRMPAQNFPPMIPDATAWCFNDGDFGLYAYEDIEGYEGEIQCGGCLRTGHYIDNCPHESK
jgi:hypothetical protein